MTIVDVAKNLNLSIATISRAINGTGKIKEETKKRVLDYVKEVGYTPNAIAINLSKQKTRNIAILVPNITNSFFSNLVLHTWILSSDTLGPDSDAKEISANNLPASVLFCLLLDFTSLNWGFWSQSEVELSPILKTCLFPKR